MTPTVAAIWRGRTPGSWAMHSRTGAWLVRTLHVATTGGYPERFLGAYCQLPVTGIVSEALRRTFVRGAASWSRPGGGHGSRQRHPDSAVDALPASAPAGRDTAWW